MFGVRRHTGPTSPCWLHSTHIREILKVTRVLHQVIKVEREHYAGPPVCGRCLAYSHSRQGCSIKPGCLFCIQDHAPGQCKGDPAKPECRKCADKFGANSKHRLGHKPTYKGCPAYQYFCQKKGIQTVKTNGNGEFRAAPPPVKVAWRNPPVAEGASAQSTPKRPPAELRRRPGLNNNQPTSGQSRQPPSPQVNNKPPTQTNRTTNSGRSDRRSDGQGVSNNSKRNTQTNPNFKQTRQQSSAYSNHIEDDGSDTDQFDFKFLLEIFRNVLTIVKI